jgi:cytidylate kinase
LDRINIDNLFCKTDNKPLDVYSLYNVEENRVKNKIKFSIDKLINAKEEKKKKLYQQYKKIYNICLNKIDLANSVGKTEMIYDVPIYIHKCDNYTPAECLEYIEDKLKELNIDTLVLSHSALFICWINI